MKLLIKGGKAVCDGGLFECDIYIENGVIIEIGQNISPANAQVLSAEGLLVLPGLIDMYCNICDPGFEHKEDIVSVSRAAACGGFTTLTCLPSTEPVIDNKAVLSYVLSHAKSRSLVNVFPYGSMTKGLKGADISPFGEMKNAGAVAISDGDRSITSSRVLYDIFKYSMLFDLPVITVCADEALSAGGVINHGKVSTMLGLCGIPNVAEEIVVSRNVQMAKATGARVHIANVSTKGSVNVIRIAKAEGINVTCHTAPRYFTLTEDYCKDYNTLAKVNPPLRTHEDVCAVKEGIYDGTIDVIASGHMPEAVESKRLEFDKASFGVSALDTAFAVSYKALVAEGRLSLLELCQKMSLLPANILGLKKKGKIAEGFDADLTLIDLSLPKTIDARNFSSKAKYSLYDGLIADFTITHTIVGGRTVFVGE